MRRKSISICSCFERSLMCSTVVQAPSSAQRGSGRRKWLAKIGVRHFVRQHRIENPLSEPWIFICQPNTSPWSNMKLVAPPAPEVRSDLGMDRAGLRPIRQRGAEPIVRQTRGGIARRPCRFSRLAQASALRRRNWWCGIRLPTTRERPPERRLARNELPCSNSQTLRLGFPADGIHPARDRPDGKQMPGHESCRPSHTRLLRHPTSMPSDDWRIFAGKLRRRRASLSGL